MKQGVDVSLLGKVIMTKIDNINIKIIYKGLLIDDTRSMKQQGPE